MNISYCLMRANSTVYCDWLQVESIRITEEKLIFWHHGSNRKEVKLKYIYNLSITQ